MHHKRRKTNSNKDKENVMLEPNEAYLNVNQFLVYKEWKSRLSAQGETLVQFPFGSNCHP